MLVEHTTKRELELRMVASKLSLIELNNIINECLDQGNFADATIYAKIYTRRKGMLEK